jgi:hypothetical protein
MVIDECAACGQDHSEGGCCICDDAGSAGSLADYGIGPVCPAPVPSCSYSYSSGDEAGRRVMALRQKGSPDARWWYCCPACPGCGREMPTAGHWHVTGTVPPPPAPRRRSRSRS